MKNYSRSYNMWKKSEAEKEIVRSFENKILKAFDDKKLKSTKRKDKLAEIFKTYKNNFIVDMYRRTINLQKNRFNYIRVDSQKNRLNFQKKLING